MAIDSNVIQNLTQYTFNASYVSNLPALIQKDLSTNLLNLVAYIIGMVLYAIVIWFFYRHLAKRDIFKVELKMPKQGFWAFLSGIWEFLMYLYRSLIIFPLITILWFLVLGGFLLFLSKSNDVNQILLMAVTIIGAARVTAYFHEDLSKDVSKLIPFALLGVFIVDQSFFSFQSAIAKFQSIPNYIHAILQYMIAIVLLEFILRTMHNIIGWIIEKQMERNND
jgi:hypothetical protein